MNWPKISIVTPSFNQAQYLEETILSVLNQRYPNLEYIIIDGGSTDGSVEIIRKYQHVLSFWVSEKDRGQVHALNKGIEHVTGEIFGFINSDDVYYPGVFTTVAREFTVDPLQTWICGDTVMFGEGHATIPIDTVVPASAAHALSWAFKAPQPGMFWSTSIIRDGFDENWPYDFDQDMYVRLLLAGNTCKHIRIPFAGYRLHAASKTVAENEHQIRESERISEHYESCLTGRDRRWCRSTRYLRNSYAASERGERVMGLKWLARAVVTHPEALASRPAWGCLRQVLSQNRAK